MMMIMKHVNLTVQGDRAYDKDMVKKAKIVKAPQSYNAKHITERGAASPTQLSSRGKQMVRPSGGDYYHEHRERDSRGPERQLGHCIWAQTASANGSIIAEGN